MKPWDETSDQICPSAMPFHKINIVPDARQQLLYPERGQWNLQNLSPNPMQEQSTSCHSALEMTAWMKKSKSASRGILTDLLCAKKEATPASPLSKPVLKEPISTDVLKSTVIGQDSHFHSCFNFLITDEVYVTKSNKTGSQIFLWDWPGALGCRNKLHPQGGRSWKTAKGRAEQEALLNLCFTHCQHIQSPWSDRIIDRVLAEADLKSALTWCS